MNQSGACSLFFAKTNKKDACFGVPQSSSLPQSCAKEKGYGVEIAFVLASITTDVILNVDLLHQSFRVVLSPLLRQLAPLLVLRKHLSPVSLRGVAPSYKDHKWNIAVMELSRLTIVTRAQAIGRGHES